MKSVTIKMPPKDHARLELAAFEARTTISDLIRRAVTEYLDRKENEL